MSNEINHSWKVCTTKFGVLAKYAQFTTSTPNEIEHALKVGRSKLSVLSMQNGIELIW